MEHKDTETVPYVDIDRYMGLWYEIGRYPLRAEKGATHVTIENIRYNDHVKIINTHIKRGKQQKIVSKAFIIPNSGNAKLKIQLFWPFNSDFWIIELDRDYQWAVISNQKQSCLWILYRNPKISNEVLFPIVHNLIKRRFNLARITWTIQ